MTITPKIAELIHKLVDYHAEWAWAAGAPTERPGVVTSLDEISIIALEGIEETLKELYWALPRLCPYCGAEMETREMHPDQLGYSTADYDCRCGAAVSVAHFPPEECCSCCGSGLNAVFPCPACGELLCQDCAPPFGAHICDPE